MWNNLTLKEKAELILAGVKAGYRDIDSIREIFNSFSKGDYLEPLILRTQEQLPVENVENSDYSVVPKLDYYKDPNEQLVNKFDKGGNYTVGNLVDAIYLNNPKEEYLGKPSHNYDFTQSEEWANAHGYYPDARGHRDDRVKKPAHPSHPSRGTWQGDNFILTDKGFEDPNYTLFGLNDGQDPLATLIYNDGVVLPEITVTPKGNYIYNSYDNIKLHLKSNGGKINRFDDGGNKKSKNSDWPLSYPEFLQPYEDVLNYLRSLNIVIDGQSYTFPYAKAVQIFNQRNSFDYSPDIIALHISNYYGQIYDKVYNNGLGLDNYRRKLMTRDYQLMNNAIYNEKILMAPSLLNKVLTSYANTRRPDGFLEDVKYWKSLITPFKKVEPVPKNNKGKKALSSLNKSLDSIEGFFTDMGTMLNSVNEGGLKLSKASNNSLESVQKADNKVRLVLNSMESSVEQSKNLPGVIYDAAQVAGQENLERRDEQYKSRDMLINSLQTVLGAHGLIGNTANMFPNLAYRTVPVGRGTILSPTLLGKIAYFKPWSASRSMLADITLDASQAFLDPTEGGKLYYVGDTAFGLAGLIGFSDVLQRIPKIGPALDFTFDAIGVLLNAKDATNFVTNFDLWAVDRLNKMIEDSDSNSEEPAK